MRDGTTEDIEKKEGKEKNRQLAIHADDEDEEVLSSSLSTTPRRSSSSSSSFSLQSKYSRRTGQFQTLSLLLNAALMLYAHLGVSGIIYSNRPLVDVAPDDNDNTTNTNNNNNNTNNNATGSCTMQDQELFDSLGGVNNRSETSSFCSQQRACLVDIPCNTECFVQQFGYSTACAECFAALPLCGFQNGCAFSCSQDAQSIDCQTCNIPCRAVFENCTGLASDIRRRHRLLSQQQDKCNILDDSHEEVLVYYEVYEIKFLNALQDAWNGDAKLLAFLVVVFSGIWPYLKNILLMMAWMTPSVSMRARILKWLKRLGKYTLVDMYVVLILLVAVWLQALIGEITIQIRGEARPAIIAFLLATIWEFGHIEWMASLHQKSLLETNKAPSDSDVDQPLVTALQFQSAHRSTTPGRSCRNGTFVLWFVWFLWLSSVVLYGAGSPLELIRFETTEGEQRDVVCERSYNLYALVTELLSDRALRDNSAKPAIWTLCLAYLLLVVVGPLLVHVVQFLALLGVVQNTFVLRLGDSIWTFASVDVVLMGVYIVQYKFDALINRLAGGAGSGILGVNGDMGPGFFVLLAYSICSGFVQYFINSAFATRYNHDPYYQIDFIWTKLLGGFVLECESRVRVARSNGVQESNRFMVTLDFVMNYFKNTLLFLVALFLAVGFILYSVIFILARVRSGTSSPCNKVTRCWEEKAVGRPFS